MSWFTETIRDPIYDKVGIKVQDAITRDTANVSAPTADNGIMEQPYALPLMIIAGVVVLFLLFKKGGV